MRRNVSVFVGAAIAVLLMGSGSAMARAGDRTLVETYPVATALCAKATHAGVLPPKLEGKRSAVVAACQTLENAFAPLVSTVDAAEAQYLTTVSQQKALIAAACVKPVKVPATCLAARQHAHATDAAALATRHAAAVSFRTAIEANRTTFWAAISALR